MPVEYLYHLNQHGNCDLNGGSLVITNQVSSGASAPDRQTGQHLAQHLIHHSALQLRIMLKDGHQYSCKICCTSEAAAQYQQVCDRDWCSCCALCWVVEYVSHIYSMYMSICFIDSMCYIEFAYQAVCNEEGCTR